MWVLWISIEEGVLNGFASGALEHVPDAPGLKEGGEDRIPPSDWGQTI